MSMRDSTRFRVPVWALAACAVSFALIAAGLLWDWPPRRAASEPGGDVSAADAREAAYGSGPTVEMKAAPAAKGKLAIVSISTPSSGDKGRSAKNDRVSAAALMRKMFPMGDVTAGAVRIVHPYRPSPELFPSFGYGEMIWSFTGKFARSGQVDLVPTGFRLDGRGVMALANTAGPGKALFVQSARDPGRFAVYRSLVR